MNKFLIIMSVFCVALAGNAAEFYWKTKKGSVVNSPDIGAQVGGTAYVFTADKASSILSLFVEGKDWSDGSLDSNEIDNGGKIAQKATTFTYGDAGQSATINAIFAVQEKIGDQNCLYISKTVEATAGSVGSMLIQFPEGDVRTDVLDAAGGFKTAGWYTVAAPEPTSGLLLLLGMAGLALRRKRV